METFALGNPGNKVHWTSVFQEGALCLTGLEALTGSLETRTSIHAWLP